MTAGVFAAMLMPLKRDGAIDDAALCRLALWLLTNGCNGVVLFGTTGEFPSFTLEERNATLDRLIEGGVPPAKIIVGTGCTDMLLKYPVTEALKEILAAESGNENWLHTRAPLCRLPAARHC